MYFVRLFEIVGMWVNLVKYNHYSMVQCIRDRHIVMAVLARKIMDHDPEDVGATIIR